MDYVFGYRSQDVRNNLRYGGQDSNKIIYHTAAIGICYDKERDSQLHHIDHSDDIIALAVHDDIVATGEIGKRPKILIWDSNSASTLHSISGFHRRGVCQLEFSADGSILASIGLDDDHSLAIYDTCNGQLLATGKGSRSKVLCIAIFGNEAILTGGDKHVKFWELGNMNGGELPSKKVCFTT